MQLQSGPPLDEVSMACILRDLLHAIEYLHNEGKIHRDIKGFFFGFPPLSFYLITCLSTITESFEMFVIHCFTVFSLTFSVSC